MRSLIFTAQCQRETSRTPNCLRPGLQHSSAGHEAVWPKSLLWAAVKGLCHFLAPRAHSTELFRMGVNGTCYLRCHEMERGKCYQNPLTFLMQHKELKFHLPSHKNPNPCTCQHDIYHHVFRSWIFEGYDDRRTLANACIYAGWFHQLRRKTNSRKVKYPFFKL